MSNALSDCKFHHATSFILFIAELSGDTIASSNVIVLPFDHISQLYQEYNTYCDSYHVSDIMKAGKQTFTKAFQKLKGQVKLLRAKGIIVLSIDGITGYIADTPKIGPKP
jgi:hypothetical protein